MKRVIEAPPGSEAEVWVQDRGGGALRFRGTVMIEDLTNVLTRLSSRTGANGPQNPVTQFILQQAAECLADRLVDDAGGSLSGEGVPRTLSSALGHQPFIESVLGLSQHQMLRRWPLATDWYTDVINYVMRSSRFEAVHESTFEQVGEWAKAPLGEFIQSFTTYQTKAVGDSRALRMVEALQALWPEYPPVRDALQSYWAMIERKWIPLYEWAMKTYGLRPRPGVSVAEIAWVFNAIHSRETLERLAYLNLPGHDGPLGADSTMTARAVLLLIAGATTDTEGRLLTLDEFASRRPIDE